MAHKKPMSTRGNNSPYSSSSPLYAFTSQYLSNVHSNDIWNQPKSTFCMQQHMTADQKRVIEEQQNKVMKRRQFDEQKEKLKAFGSGQKMDLTADSMIKNILDSPRDVFRPQLSRFSRPVFDANVTPSWDNPAFHSQLSATAAPLDFTNLSLLKEEHCTFYNSAGITLKSICKKPVIIPSWLKDENLIPKVYLATFGLVEANDEWVDTKRAYMILMKTGLPQSLLGYLWEIVNISQLGQLSKHEFLVLLALVALAQKGVAITSDVLSTVVDPVVPIIDHPALLPLSKQYADQFNKSGKNLYSEDDFSDFVGYMSTGKENGLFGSENFAVFEENSIPPVKDMNSLLPEKEKKLNLPEVGSSPQFSPSASFDQLSSTEDEFQDFQTAGFSKAVEDTDRKLADKYAAFKVLDIENVQFKNDETLSPINIPHGSDNIVNSVEDEFGSFQGMGTVLNIENFKNVMEFADFNSAFPSTVCSADSFKPGRLSDEPFLDNKPTPITKKGEDEFGDFMGSINSPVVADEYLSCEKNGSRFEVCKETQSVSSLELGGLDFNLCESKNSSNVHSPDLFYDASSELSDSLKEMQLEQSDIHTCNVISADKYSIIRQEADKSDVFCKEEHAASWEKCLISGLKLINEAKNVICNLSQEPSLFIEALSTSQFNDYFNNITEVWLVCERIRLASQSLTTNSKVDELLCCIKSSWAQILSIAEDHIPKDIPVGRYNAMDSVICGVCLLGDGVALSYAGHYYHPPCANLWINCVDLTLPSLRNVAL